MGCRAGFWSTLWKNFKMPCSFFNWTPDSSSDGGADNDEIEERSDESSSAIFRVVVVDDFACGCGFVDGVEGRAGRKWAEGGGAVTEIGCEKLRTGQQWSALAATAPRIIEHDRWICLYLVALSTYQRLLVSVLARLTCQSLGPTVSFLSLLIRLLIRASLFTGPDPCSRDHHPAIAATITTLIFNICRKHWPRMAKPYNPREEVCSP